MTAIATTAAQYLIKPEPHKTNCVYVMAQDHVAFVTSKIRSSEPTDPLEIEQRRERYSDRPMG